MVFTLGIMAIASLAPPKVGCLEEESLYRLAGPWLPQRATPVGGDVPQKVTELPKTVPDQMDALGSSRHEFGM